MLEVAKVNKPTKAEVLRKTRVKIALEAFGFDALLTASKWANGQLDKSAASSEIDAAFTQFRERVNGGQDLD